MYHIWYLQITSKVESIRISATFGIGTMLDRYVTLVFYYQYQYGIQRAVAKFMYTELWAARWECA